MNAKLANVMQGSADVLIDGAKVGFVSESKSGWWYGWLVIGGNDYRVSEWRNPGRRSAMLEVIKAHEEQVRIRQACANQS